MPLPSCTCSCSQHAPRRRETNDAYTRQSGKTFHTEDGVVFFEEGDVEVEEHTYDNNEDAIAFEREEKEEAVSALQLQVRVLRKYKSNYELLCGQLGELNAQIGLQLQRHESDVTALQASIADLQGEKVALETQLLQAQQALTVQREAANQDRDYSEHVHQQLDTAAVLLKATEKRLEEQEVNFTEEIERLKAQIAIGKEEHAESAKRMEEEIEALRVRQVADKEKEVLRRQQEKRNHKKELMAYRAKLRAVSDELESQRSVLRSTKKHLTQVQTDNETLRKQLANVQRDGAHLSDIIDSQRAEYESNTDELRQIKKAKTQLAKRVAVVDQEAGQLQNKLAEAEEELVFKNNQLEDCRDERLDTFQTAGNERCVKVRAVDQEQRAIQERKYRIEMIRMQELLADNQQRATESSKDVQKLRHELLNIQKLLHGCTEDVTPESIDQWRASHLKNQSSILDQVRAFSA
eukprot:jgi/Phyca11/122949/e_gw1.49.177.1